MQQKIFSILFEKDEVTWKSLIQRLIREEGMDPWDIDVSLIAKKYVKILKKLKDMDFRLSGKVVLAAAILLKMKSSRLVGEDLTELDRLIASAEPYEDDFAAAFYDQLEMELDEQAPVQPEIPDLVPKTPQPRTRKVSVYDLMEALEQALVVKKRRIVRNIPEKKMEIPKKEKDITEVIKVIYNKIVGFFDKNDKELFFTELIESDTKEDKVFTFIPLLHLDRDCKVSLDQKQHFGPIQISLRN